MKTFTKKKQVEILKRLAANIIIIENARIDVESFACLIDNSYEIARLVGGIEGLTKVHNSVHNYAINAMKEIELFKEKL